MLIHSPLRNRSRRGFMLPMTYALGRPRPAARAVLEMSWLTLNATGPQREPLWVTRTGRFAGIAASLARALHQELERNRP
jgi:hypothetical protein